jgi:hypothetical protein
MFTDIIAAIPLDYLAILAPQWVGAWLRLLRLIKVGEVTNVLTELTQYSRTSMTMFYLTLYFIMFIYLTHFAACMMFFIGRIQLEEYPHSRFDNRTWISVFGEASYHQYEPLLD